MNANETPVPAAPLFHAEALAHAAHAHAHAGARAPRLAADLAQAPAAGPRRRAPHDDLLSALGRRFRGATLELDFELRTSAARQIFRRDFVYVSRQLHALEASRRVQDIDRQLLGRALAAIEQRAAGARMGVQRCAAEVRALIELHADAGAPLQFGRPTLLQATIVSPYARLFLDLLALADDALAQIEKAWLLGLIDPATKTRRTSDCRKALHGFKEAARQQRHVVGEHVRQVNARQRPDARRDPAVPADAPAQPAIEAAGDAPAG